MVMQPAPRPVFDPLTPFRVVYSLPRQAHRGVEQCTEISLAEDRELSEDEFAEPEPHSVKLFPPDQFPRLLALVMQTLKLKKAVLLGTEPNQSTELGPSSVLPNYQESSVGFPLPNFVMPLIENEWANPTKGRDTSSPPTRLFNLDKKGMQLLKSPLGDTCRQPNSSRQMVPP